MKVKDIAIQHQDGSYELTQVLEIKSPNGMVKLGPGARLMPGVKMFGIDIVDLLEIEMNH